MNNYCVYKHTSPSGKVYIGITSKKPTLRWGLRGQQYSGSKIFYEAIQKYGWSNFTHEILYENLSKDEAETIEIRLISEYKSNDRNHGYNITSGGGGASGYSQTEDHIRKRVEKTTPQLRGRKLSEEHKRHIQENNGKYWLGKHRSVETRQKLSVAMTEEVKAKLVSAAQSEEARRKRIETMRKRPHEYYVERNKHRRKPVKQCDPVTHKTIEVFPSATEAERITGTRKQDISACIKGRQKTANGYRWELFEEETLCV